MSYFYVTCSIGPMAVTNNDPRSHEMFVEQWIQRELVQQNGLQVDLRENSQGNEILEGQTLLGEGWSNCSSKRKLESEIWRQLN